MPTSIDSFGVLDGRCIEPSTLVDYVKHRSLGAAKRHSASSPATNLPLKDSQFMIGSKLPAYYIMPACHPDNHDHDTIVHVCMPLNLSNAHMPLAALRSWLAGQASAQTLRAQLPHGGGVRISHRHQWLADLTSDPLNRQPGETRIIAVFRVVIFAKRGATVKVPAELIQQ